MINILCDTSFLLILATKKIKNLNQILVDIGNVQLVVPDIVIEEIKKLCNNENKKHSAVSALCLIKNLNKTHLPNVYVDDALVFDIKKHGGGIIATIDKKLKKRIKKIGGSVLTISNDFLVLEQ